MKKIVKHCSNKCFGHVIVKLNKTIVINFLLTNDLENLKNQIKFKITKTFFKP